MHYILAITYITWFLSEVIISRTLRATEEENITDKRSLKMVWVAAIGSVACSIVLDKIFPFRIFTEEHLRVTGAAVTLMGMAIRVIAVMTLGRMFTVDITIRKNHQLKTTGIYRHIRHPAYAGLLLGFYGLGIAFDNWLCLVIIAVPITVVLVNRIRKEEELLVQTFGEEYLKYRKRSKYFIPYIY